MTTDLTALQQRYPNWMIRPNRRQALFIATRRDRYHLTADELGSGLAKIGRAHV